MGIFRIEITGRGPHGCDRVARHDDSDSGKLYRRCSKLTCVDCLTYDFVNALLQKGYGIGEATFTHNAGAVTDEVVDNLLKNARRSGKFY